MATDDGRRSTIDALVALTTLSVKKLFPWFKTWLIESKSKALQATIVALQATIVAIKAKIQAAKSYESYESAASDSRRP